MKSKIIVFLVAITFIMMSCLSTDKEAIPVVNKEKRLFPVLIDTLPYKVTRMDVKFKKTGNYKPIFLGKFTDTIIINHYIGNGSMIRDTSATFKKHFKYYHRDIGNYTTASPKNVTISIDTTTIIKQVDFQGISDGSFIFEAHPLYISNISKKDTVSLGFSYDIRTGLEAKNHEGVWQEIERVTFVGCPVGLKEFVLKPQDTIITSTPIFKGNFKTKLRLKLGETYSNEFDGYINEQQFILSTF